MPRINEAVQQRDRENARLKPTGRTFYARTPKTEFKKRDVAGHHPEFRLIFLNDDKGITATLYATEVEFASWVDKDAKDMADEFQKAYPDSYTDAQVVEFFKSHGFVGIGAAPRF